MGVGELFLIFLIGLAGSLAAIALWHYMPKLWRWAKGKLAEQMKHALGIEGINEKLGEIDDTVFYMLREQMEMDERIAKLEGATHNPGSPSPETEDTDDKEGADHNGRL